MNTFEKDIAFYINSFDTEKLLYSQGKEWAKKGWLSREEFLAICMWKSRRPKNLYTQNSSLTIKEITRKAFKESDESNKMQILTSLAGVEIPTASAILSVTDPQNYPVIDIRCVEALLELKLIDWSRISLSNWVKYLAVVRSISKRKKKSAREVEKGLFAFNKLNLDREFKNLYDQSRRLSLRN